MDSHNVLVVLGGILIAAIVVLSFVWSASRGKSMLEGWARENGYHIVFREECWFFRGPFFWTTSKGQKVYRVMIEDREGTYRNGYVRVGGWWLGLWSDHVEARWDD
jgi:hypothetical protein